MHPFLVRAVFPKKMLETTTGKKIKHDESLLILSSGYY